MVYHSSTYAGVPLLLCSDWTWADLSPAMSHLDFATEWESQLPEKPEQHAGSSDSSSPAKVSVVNLAHGHTTRPNLAEVQLSNHFLTTCSTPAKSVCKLRHEGAVFVLGKAKVFCTLLKLKCVQIVTEWLFKAVNVSVLWHVFLPVSYTEWLWLWWLWFSETVKQNVDLEPVLVIWLIRYCSVMWEAGEMLISCLQSSIGLLQ